MWNVRGWSLTDNENDYFRQSVTEYTNFDILALCETFLRDNDEISVDGYKFIGHNRTNIHKNARRGSGGIGVLIKWSLLKEFDYSLDSTEEDFLWVKLKHKLSGFKLNLCVCYLPPANSSRPVDPEAVFTNLLKTVYEYQNDGNIVLCGDFNARCGNECDYIEGVDPIPPREALDEQCNAVGYQFIDFLVDCNLCMLNGRIGRNNYTCISPLGKSVVDYICVPQEILSSCSSFEVLTMSELINDLGLHGHTKIPDHSLLHFCLDLPSAELDHTKQIDSNPYSSCTTKYNVNEIPASFLNDEQSFDLLNQTILSIENAISVQADMGLAYDKFTTLLNTEMESKLKKRNVNISHKGHKSRAKPYWSDILQDAWVGVCNSEKRWLSCKIVSDKKRLKEEHFNQKT